MTTSVQQSKSARRFGAADFAAPRRLRLIGAATAAMIFVMALAIWLELVREEQARFRDQIVTEAHWAAHHVEFEFNEISAAIERMGQRWEYRSGTPHAEWEVDARAYLAGFPGAEVVAWFDAAGRHRWSVPDTFNARALDPSAHAVQARALKQADASRRLTVSDPFQLADGTGLLTFNRPLYPAGRADGHFVIGVNVNATLLHILPPALATGYAIDLARAGDVSQKPDDVPSALAPLKLGGSDWILRVTPDATTLERARSVVPVAALWGATASSVLVFALFGLWSVAARRVAETAAANTALAQSEARWQFALDGGDLGVWDHDRRTGRVFYSRRWKQLLGYADDAIGDTIAEWDARIHPDDKAQRDADLQRHLRGDSATFVNEHRVRCKDGSYKWMLARGKVIERGADGRPLRVIGTHVDISERHRADESLHVQAHAMDAVPLGVSIVDATAAEQPLVYVNSAFERITGYARDEVLGRNSRFLQGTNPDQQGVRELRAALAEGRAEWVLLRNYRKDGAMFWNELAVTPVRDGAGRVTHFVGIQHDVTARIEKDRALRENEQLLKDAQRIAHVGHWALDVPSGKLFWSDEIYRIFGCAPGAIEPSYERFFEFVHPDDVTPVKESEQRAFTAAGKHSIDHRIVLPDGNVRWVHEEAESKFDADGKPVLLAGTVQDITARKQIEEAWRAGQARLRAVLDTAVDGIITIDAQGVIESFNPAAERIFGYTAAEVIGRNISVLMPSPYRAEHDGYIANYLTTGEAKIIGRGREVQGQRKDGAIVPVDLAVSEMSVNGRRMFTGLVRDITARKTWEAELVAARDAAEKASRAKSDFLSSMSHELRTPLNSIIGFAQLLETDEPPLTEQQREQVQYIVKSGYILLGLINDLLDLSRIESGRLPLSIEPVPLDQVIDATVQLIQPLLRRNELTLTVDGGAGLCVAADYVRMKQVLTNFLSNAAKYNRRGGAITVSCAARDDGYVRIAVKDTGIGIPADRRAELFTSFQRLGRENSTIEGTGIGLVITKRLTEMMNGRIGFESESGVGSTFWVEFPAARAAEMAPSATAPAIGATAAADQTAARTVLYVEDNPANLRFMERLIARQADTRLLSAPEPGLGLELARAHRPDLILLDINLPGMDGYEVLRRLRADAATAHIPVIAVTANAMPHEVELGNAAGFDGYVTKPINVALFLHVLDDALRAQRDGGARPS